VRIGLDFPAAANLAGIFFGFGAASAVPDCVDAEFPVTCGKFPAIAGQGIFPATAGMFLAGAGKPACRAIVHWDSGVGGQGAILREVLRSCPALPR